MKKKMSLIPLYSILNPCDTCYVSKAAAMTTKRKSKAPNAIKAIDPIEPQFPRVVPALPNGMPDFTQSAPHLAIADILEADRLESELREADRAYNECLDIRARMASTKARSMTGSLLEALGLGRPKTQGGRATSIPMPSASPKGKHKLQQAV